MLTRRQFLGRSAAGLSVLSLSGQVPGLFVQAADEAEKRASTDRVLVVIELNGGNDGLNTVIPFEDDLYYKNRPTLGIPKDQVLKLNDHVGLHPSLEEAAKLFKDGKLNVVQGVGYPQPDRSHFRSMEIWHTASTASTPPSTGWLGRAADHRFAPGDEEKLFGLSLIEKTRALSRELRADFLVERSVDNNGLFRSADGAVVETGSGQDVSHGFRRVGGALDERRHVAWSDAERGFAG